MTNFSKYLCEELTTKLFQTKKFNVVERSQLNKIVVEQELELTGPIDQEVIKSLGRLTGAEAILTGTIIDMETHIRINARVISVTSGSILSARSVYIFKDDLIINLLKTNKNIRSTSGYNYVLNNYSDMKEK